MRSGRPIVMLPGDRQVSPVSIYFATRDYHACLESCLGNEKGHIERYFEMVAPLSCQFASGYTGRSPDRRDRHAENRPLWSMAELQEPWMSGLSPSTSTAPMTGSATLSTPGGPSSRTKVRCPRGVGRLPAGLAHPPTTTSSCCPPSGAKWGPCLSPYAKVVGHCFSCCPSRSGTA